VTKKRWFITGTDTDAGKTVFATGLLSACTDAGFLTAALKPVAAGGIHLKDGFFNEDALMLQVAASQKDSYKDVNPYLFEQPIAPHIAAANEGRKIGFSECVERCRSIIDSPADIVVVEGAGGWLVPLNDQKTVADLAEPLGCEIILVVGLKLGCLNHALLTVASIEASGLKLAGWVANHLSSDMPYNHENIATLKEKIVAPLVAEIPFLSAIDTESSAVYIDIPTLLEETES
tara:strand:+ start:10920 stop:11618 length:699 start_codon:yes stop_codon:yes gene_type:complete